MLKKAASGAHTKGVPEQARSCSVAISQAKLGDNTGTGRQHPPAAGDLGLLGKGSPGRTNGWCTVYDVQGVRAGWGYRDQDNNELGAV